MSYKNKKSKKSRFNQLWRKFRLVKIALFQFISKVERKENNMRLPQTRAVMQLLREKSRGVRSNNLKINEWVDDYIDERILNGKPIEILTQFCISKDLEVRFEEQGKRFVPTKKERQLFEKEFPAIAKMFKENAIGFNWWLTFNRSYLDSGRINLVIEDLYKEMIQGLAGSLVKEGWLMLLDWENDILGKRAEPDAEVLESIERMVNPGALQLEIQRHSAWARDEARLNQSDDELKRDVYFQIACEAMEGRILSGQSSFGDCLLFPLEVPERYDFFALKAPDFKKRIVAVLSPYPWRI